MVNYLSKKISIKLREIHKLHSTQIIILSFLAAIAVGTILLSLPAASTKGHLSVIDALFTSTSAVCVTGLIVVDTATHFTKFGQTVILVLIQLGGLGIMTFGVVFTLIMGGKIGIKDRMVMQDTLYHSPSHDIKQLIKAVFLTTFTIEFIGF